MFVSHGDSFFIIMPIRDLCHVKKQLQLARRAHTTALLPISRYGFQCWLCLSLRHGFVVVFVVAVNCGNSSGAKQVGASVVVVVVILTSRLCQGCSTWLVWLIAMATRQLGFALLALAFLASRYLLASQISRSISIQSSYPPLKLAATCSIHSRSPKARWLHGKQPTVRSAQFVYFVAGSRA